MDQYDQDTLLHAHYASLSAFWESALERTGYCAILLSAGQLAELHVVHVVMP